MFEHLSFIHLCVMYVILWLRFLWRQNCICRPSISSSRRPTGCKFYGSNLGSRSRTISCWTGIELKCKVKITHRPTDKSKSLWYWIHLTIKEYFSGNKHLKTKSKIIHIWTCMYILCISDWYSAFFWLLETVSGFFNLIADEINVCKNVQYSSGALCNL